MQTLPTRQLQPHPRNERIYGYEAIEELASKINDSGWIKPLVVTSDYVIVSGHRRWKAAQLLGIDSLPCEVRHFANDMAVLEALLLENEYREKTTEQRAREASVWFEIESAKAKARMLAGKAIEEVVNPMFPGNIGYAETGATRDIVAVKAGFSSGNTFERAHRVVQAIDNSPAPVADALRVVLEKSVRGAEELTKKASPETILKVADSLRANPELSVSQAVKDIQDKPHVSNNSGNNEWYTPAPYIKAAKEVMGQIDLDPASSELANQTIGASIYFDAATNGLNQHWQGKVWLNPPYAGELIGLFCDKLIGHVKAGDITKAIILVNNATETKWGQALLTNCNAICFPASRIKFIDMEGNPTGAPLQGQMVAYFGPNSLAFAASFSQFGMVFNV